MEPGSGGYTEAFTLIFRGFLTASKKLKHLNPHQITSSGGSESDNRD